MSIDKIGGSLGGYSQNTGAIQPGTYTAPGLDGASESTQSTKTTGLDQTQSVQDVKKTEEDQTNLSQEALGSDQAANANSNPNLQIVNNIGGSSEVGQANGMGSVPGMQPTQQAGQDGDATVTMKLKDLQELLQKAGANGNGGTDSSSSSQGLGGEGIQMSAPDTDTSSAQGAANAQAPQDAQQASGLNQDQSVQQSSQASESAASSDSGSSKS